MHCLTKNFISRDNNQCSPVSINNLRGSASGGQAKKNLPSESLVRLLQWYIVLDQIADNMSKTTISPRTAETKILYSLSITSGLEIGDEDFLVTDKKIFGDEDEHEVSFIFFDGYAIGHSYSEDKGMLTLTMKYPFRMALTAEDKEEIREYDGIPAPRTYTYRDIALCFGEVQLVNI